MKKIGIIGAGSWGTALAVAINNSDNEVVLWSRSKEVADCINKHHENIKYLSKINLPEDISATDSLSSLTSSQILLLVIPSQKLRSVCQSIKEASFDENAPLVICCKGIEQGSQKLMSEIVAEVLPNNPVAILSGPNFAREIALGLPAGATLACEDEKLGMQLVEALGGHLFRTYFSHDVVGAQIGGAVKNVLAIACGIAIGKGFGENARAALVTRGMAEIHRLCVSKGGKLETLMGLSGIGDIMLTCGSHTSRNMSLGFALGEGNDFKATKGQIVTEGVATSQSVTQLAASLGVDMPICKAVNDILHEGADIDNTVKQLLHRPLTVE